MYFFIGEFSIFFLSSVAGNWKWLLCTDIGFFLREFEAFHSVISSDFLFYFFVIQFLPISLLSFWLYFIRCWIVWAFLRSPLISLFCCLVFPHSYLLFWEQNLLTCSYSDVWSSSVLDFVTYFYLLLPCAHSMLVPSYLSLVLSLLGNELFSLLELLIYWWLYSFFGAWRSVMVFYSHLILTMLTLFNSSVRVLQ